jgi:hypothetical protein
MLAVCGRGVDAAEVVDAYLHAGRRIPADLYQESVEQLIETWTWPNPPQPGDILRVSQQIEIERRMAVRERERYEYQAQMIADAMTPAQARKLLAGLEAQPEPQSQVLASARELQMRILRVAAGRGTRELVDGVESL